MAVRMLVEPEPLAPEMMFRLPELVTRFELVMLGSSDGDSSPAKRLRIVLSENGQRNEVTRALA